MRRKRKVYSKPIEGARAWNRYLKEYRAFCDSSRHDWKWNPSRYNREDVVSLVSVADESEVVFEKYQEFDDVCLNRLDWRKAMTT